ncbi:hypothetical protein, partial [Paracoccus fontiphilus]
RPWDKSVRGRGTLAISRFGQQSLHSEHAMAEITKGLQKASEMFPRSKWPEWAEMSVDGRLNGHWPWAQSGMKEFLLQEARKLA